MSSTKSRVICFQNLFIALVVLLEFSDAAKYTFVVKTGTQSRPGNLDGPGTDANIYVILYGISKVTNKEDQTKPIKLSGSFFHNYFEQGKTDTFKNLKDSKDLTKLYKIGIKRSSHLIGPDWLLEKLSVTTQDGATYDFNANVWLTKAEKYYEISAAAGPGVTNPTTSLQTQINPTPVQAQVNPTTVQAQINPTAVQTQINPTPTQIQGTASPVPGAPNPATSTQTQGTAAQTTKPTTAEAMYNIVVKTGSESKPGTLDGPGTDATITVILYGISRTTNQADSTKPLELSGSILKNNFESGQTDTFDVKDTKDLTSLNKIQIKRNNFGIGPAWLLQELTVTTQDKKTYRFNANLWLTQADKYYDVAVAADITYDIIVYTGSAQDSSSSANIFLTLYGEAGPSSEIHLKSPSGQETFVASSSKVFQLKLGDLKRITKIKLRQDGSGVSPNWKVDKFMVLGQNGIIYEFVINGWLEPANPLEQTLTSEYAATSLKFNSYTPCVHPLDSKIHPEPKSSIVLKNSCSQLATYFRLLRDGVIIHLASGTCLQGETTGDPKAIAAGSKLVLNTQCNLYQSGSTTPYALQFKFTSGKSLKEINSGKCISTNQGVMDTPLTFSDICDTDNTKIGFIGKSGKILIPEKTEKPAQAPPRLPPTAEKPAQAPPRPPAPAQAPPRPPAAAQPPANPSTPGAPTSPIPPNPTTQKTPNTGNKTTDQNLIDPEHPELGGNNSHVPGGPLPGGYCPSGCSPTCQPSCTQACCGPQQPNFPEMPSFPQPRMCPEMCTPANCRSTCHISCCSPPMQLNVWQRLMMANNGNQRRRDWD